MADTAAQITPHRRNFGLQAAGEASFVAGTTIASTEGLLTWFATHMGGSYILAALVVPICMLGNLGSVYYLAAHLTRMERRRIAVVFLGSAVVGVLMALAIVLPLVSGYAGIAFLLLAGIAYGMFSGLFTIAQTELKKRCLADDHIVRAQLIGAGLGGITTLGILLVLHFTLPWTLASHSNLLWLAAIAWVGAIVAFGYVQEASAGAGRRAGERPRRLVLGVAMRQRWFRGLSLNKFVFLSVELTVPFYVIHAATVHAPTLKNVTAIVGALGIGSLIGGPLWSRMPRARPWIGASVAALVAALGGVVILVVDDLDPTRLLYVHFSVLVVVAAAGVGANRSRVAVTYKALPAENREAALGTYAAVGVVLMIGAATVLGAAADLHNLALPLSVLVAANIAAAIYATTGMRRFWVSLARPAQQALQPAR